MHWKRKSSLEERMNSLPEGEWASAESQKGIMQDNVRSVYLGATPR